MIRRILEILISGLVLILLSPILLVIYLSVRFNSAGPGIFKQSRVGKNNQDFVMYKFRSMHTRKTPDSLLTIGFEDKRITSVGKFLRKYKLDELPQFWNVLIGDMSLVGPRPEVRKFVDLYTEEQLKVLLVRPGITDYASLKYFHEDESLKQVENPEQHYIDTIMPEKLAINLEYLQRRSLVGDFLVLMKTVFRVFK